MNAALAPQVSNQTSLPTSSTTFNLPNTEEGFPIKFTQMEVLSNLFCFIIFKKAKITKLLLMMIATPLAALPQLERPT